MRRLLVVCNAIDDATRLSRNIFTDSPAASRKIFMMGSVLREAGIRPWVISLGRGRPSGHPKFHKAKITRQNGCAVYYLPYSNVKFLSQAISLLALAIPLIRFSRKRGRSGVLFYNRMPAYIIGLLTTKVTGLKAYLDLEDGEVSGSAGRSVSVTHYIRKIFDHVCIDGALLACSALKSFVPPVQTLCYYGTIDPKVSDARLPEGFPTPIRVLLGGTISLETGASSLLDVLAAVDRTRPSWARFMAIEITGKGDLTDAFLQYTSRDCGFSEVLVHGRTTDETYKEIMGRCHVGLALKPGSGDLANTTFPSKVVEIASAGLLLVSTDISDVRELFGEDAIYVEAERPDTLLRALESIANDPSRASILAKRGQSMVQSLFNPTNVAAKLAQFFCHL